MVNKYLLCILYKLIHGAFYECGIDKLSAMVFCKDSLLLFFSLIRIYFNYLQQRLNLPLLLIESTNMYYLSIEFLEEKNYVCTSKEADIYNENKLFLTKRKLILLI